MGFMVSKYIDVKTGEIKYEPDFFKLYIKELCSVKGLSALQSEMFKFMLLNMNHENLVSYSSIKKNKFLDEQKIKPTTFNNNIKGLILSGLIKRAAIGEFIVNKKYTVKADWEKIQEIKWETTYNKSGKKDYVKIKSND